MNEKKMEIFLEKLDYISLERFDRMYSAKRIELLSEYWTLDHIRDELSYYMDCYMDDYLMAIGESDYYPADFEHKFDIEDELFLKFLGVRSIEHLLLDVLFYNVISEGRSINEVVDFAWDDYCKYYHGIMTRNEKLKAILE